MVRSSLKYFFRNLLYVFVPMGIVYLFLLITLFWLFSAVLGEASGAIGAATQLIGDSLQASSASVQDFFRYAFGQINWNGNFFQTLRTVLDTHWIQNTLQGFFDTLNASSAGFSQQLGAIIDNFTKALVQDLSLALSGCALGVVAANFVTRQLLRRKVARRNWKNFLLAHTLVPIAESLSVVAATILFAFIRYYSLLVLVASLALMAVFSLTSSWLIHAGGKLKWKDVVTREHVLSYLGALGVLLLVNALLALVLWLINPLLALLLMIPVLIYTINVADVNTDAFVCRLVAGRAEAEGGAQTPEGAAQTPAPASVQADKPEEGTPAKGSGKIKGAKKGKKGGKKAPKPGKSGSSAGAKR